MLQPHQTKVTGENPDTAPHPKKCRRCHVMYYFDHTCTKKIEDRQKQKIRDRINHNRK